MHARILGVALAAVGTFALAADDVEPDAHDMGCPSASAAVTERFLSADCQTCWTDKALAVTSGEQWLLDWIVPSARGDAAPLASAAPPEARARAQRALKKAPLDARRTVVQQSAARRASASPLRVVSGPAWSGYFAVQVNGVGRIAGAHSVWLALVETVPAGTDGTVVPRELVRTVAGPYAPTELRSGGAWDLMHAMRWPETAKPVRLRARAWIEDAAGRIVAMAGERCTAQ
jgi:hypothetical protein